MTKKFLKKGEGSRNNDRGNSLTQRNLLRVLSDEEIAVLGQDELEKLTKTMTLLESNQEGISHRS